MMTSLRSHAFFSVTIALVALFSTIPQANAQSSVSNSKAIEKELEARYKGKVLRLRHFQKGDFLRYTKSGSLIQTLDEGTWTLYSLLEIQDIAIKDDRVQFKGK